MVEDDRRKFLRRTAAAGGTFTLGTLAGCQGNDGSESDSDTDGSDGGGTPDATGEKVPELLYYNNPQSYNPVRHDVINFISERLGEVGFDVNVETQEWGTLYQKVVDETDYDLTTWVGYIGSDPGAMLLDHYTPDGPQNFTNWAPDELATLLQDQMAETDTDTRVDMIHEAQEMIVEGTPMTAIQHAKSPSIYNEEHISSIEMNQSGIHGFWNMANLEAEVDDIVSNWPEGLGTLNIFSWGTEVKLQYQFELLYDKLLRIDPDFQIDAEHGLATDYEQPDAETIVFKIRNDHVFHDGEPVTVDDVAFSINYLKENEAPAFASQLSYIDNAEVVDDTTVQVNLGQPLGPADFFIGASLPILPQHIWGDIDAPLQQETSEELVIGSGPMQFDYWDRNAEFALATFDDHFLDLDFERRIWRIIPESTTVQELLRNGDLSYNGFSFNEQIAAILEEEDHLVGVETTSPYTLHFSMNTERLEEKELRKAAADAIPKELIINEFYDGFAIEGKTPVSPRWGAYHNPDVPETAESVEAARSRLEEAGYGWDDNGLLHYPE